MTRLLAVIVGLALLAALLNHCLRVRPPQIEAEVLACVQGRMGAEGLAGVAVGIDGRDVTLTGAVGTQAERSAAEKAALRDCGVRVLENALTVLPAAPYRTSLCIGGEGLRLAGSVPDARAREHYLKIAKELFGNVPLEDDIGTRAGAPEGFDRFMRAAFTKLAQLDEGCIEVVDRKVMVTGDVRTVAARDRLVADLDSAAGTNFSVTYSLSVPQLSAGGLACQQALDVLLAPGEQVLFDFDSAEIHQEGKELLDEAERIWQTCPEISLIVAGHTDSRGDAEYNRALSERRARAVVDYLIAKGLDPARLTAIGYGESQPQATNETEEGQALNRRMEFRVREKSR
jgi:OOP family OmpA-OmpF porin